MILSMSYTTLLGLECGSYVAVYAGPESSDLVKNILICVPKMIKGLTGLERHEGNDRILNFGWTIALILLQKCN